jgi:hypothetical protein
MGVSFALEGPLIFNLRGKLFIIIIFFSSAQHLKHRFGNGVFLSLKLTTTLNEPKMTQMIRMTFSQAFIDVIPAAGNGNMEVRLQMPSLGKAPSGEVGHLSLGRVFSTLEEAKSHGILEAYSVKETSLEQIFVAFAANRVFA